MTRNPTVATVDLGAIWHNLCQIAQTSPAPFLCPVIKANAYGHGAIQVAQTMIQHPAVRYLAVAKVEEGVQLRQAGITTPILILGGLARDQISDFFQWQLTPAASSVEKLRDLESFGAQHDLHLPVHLKIDTGMGRIGVQWDRAEKLLNQAAQMKQVIIEGIFTHFSDAEDGIEYTELQHQRFAQVVATAKKLGLDIPYIHSGKSGAIGSYRLSGDTMTRPGISLYGISPFRDKTAADLNLKPALTWTTQVVYFKTLPAGYPVGYGRTYYTKTQTRIATIPVGYADGFPRRLSNAGHVMIRGRRFPIAGRVCMDQTMIDLGPDGEAYTGDIVTLIGTDGSETICAEDIATTIGTTPHEITTCISSRVPREFLAKE